MCSVGRVSAIQCELRIRGRLPAGWADWLDGLACTDLDGQEALLAGQVADQAALLGALLRLHSWNVQLVAVICREMAASE